MEAKRGWIKTERGYRPIDERMQQIVAWIEAGSPYRLIADNFQITVARVSAIRRKAGIPRRKHPAESI